MNTKIFMKIVIEEYGYKTIFLAGAISDNKNYKQQFANAIEEYRNYGFKVLSPTFIPDNLEYKQYFPITFGMIDTSDMMVVLSGGDKSKGVQKEIAYAKLIGKPIYYQRTEILHHDRSKKQEEDMVNNPNHYTDRKFECIEEMEILFGKEATIDYCKLAAYKYKHRADLKGKREEDLDKADWYLSKVKELVNQ